MEQKVLDAGFVRLLDVFGDELTVVNTARVSFGGHKDSLDDQDVRLLRYLVRNDHTSPFRGVMLRFHLRAPLFVKQQIYKHVVGSEWFAPTSTQLHGWNEMSGRYCKMTDIYHPEEWRRQSTDSKQGSEGVIDPALALTVDQKYQGLVQQIVSFYTELCDAGIAKEQARIILPLGLYTECIWTVSFQAIMNFLLLRLDKHAQWEIQQYARAIADLVQKKLPLLFSLWKEHYDLKA